MPTIGVQGQQQMNSLALVAQRPRNRKVARGCLSKKSYQALDDPVVTTDWLARHLDQVSILDVRGHVSTELVQPGVEKSTYSADYDAYLEGHIPVRAAAQVAKCSADAASLALLHAATATAGSAHSKQQPVVVESALLPS